MRAAHHEDTLVAALVGTEWRIDPDGSIWRIAVKLSGTAPMRPIEPRRTECVVPDGYLRVQGNPNGTGTKRVLAHRAVWVYFNGSIPDHLQVNHKNGIKTDNRPENLELVTAKDNCRHRNHVLGHKMPSGYRIGSIKLTPAQVLEIRAAWTGTWSCAARLARKYAVEPKTIRDAATHRTWRDIPRSKP